MRSPTIQIETKTGMMRTNQCDKGNKRISKRRRRGEREKGTVR